MGAHQPGACGCCETQGEGTIGGGCAEALFQWFDCGNCDPDFPCYWWLQYVTNFAFDPATGRYSTPIGDQTLIGPIDAPPGPVACMKLVGGAITITAAGYVHMLPNSGGATATVNGNAAYTWSLYGVGDTLSGTYNIPTTGNDCLDCHGADPIDCGFTKNDVVPPFNP